MELDELTRELKTACNKLYESNKYLIDEKSNEISIASLIETYLRERIKDWDIDSNYMREGNLDSRTTKRDLDDTIIIPDIIIHKHGPDGPNIAAIEIKGYWNPQNRSIDENKLRKLQLKHNYRFLFRIELLHDSAEVIQVDGIL